MSEVNVMRKIMKAVSATGVRIFRNNVGQCWIGKSKYITREDFYRCRQGDVIISNARRFHAGLEGGSGDLIGWTPVEITQEMVGKTVAIFTSLEVKADDLKAESAKTSNAKHEKSQQNFARVVNAQGGFAEFVGSEDAAVSAITEKTERLKS